MKRREPDIRSPRRRAWLIAGLGVLVLLHAAPSSHAAGITAFVQLASPSTRAGSGFALAVPLLTEIISLEGEYARSGEEDSSPSLTLASGSLVLTSPVEFLRLRPYFVTGFGIYRQVKDLERETSLAALGGFGVFLRLGGPIHGRFDYRAIRLQGSPMQTGQKRFYAGLTLRF
jgi:hypothetical protein